MIAKLLSPLQFHIPTESKQNEIARRERRGDWRGGEFP
jgi:hypothetical protein